MTELSTGEVARMLQVSPNTVRAWERRSGLLPGRKPGGHRRFRRTLALAIRDAMGEGLIGRSMLERALELERTGRYAMPGLAERLDRIEEEMRGCRALLAQIVRLLDNAGIVRRGG